MWGNWRAQSIQRVSRRWLIASTRHRPHRRWRLIPLAASIAATHYTTSRLSSLFPAGRESWATGGHRLGRPTRPFPSLYPPPPLSPIGAQRASKRADGRGEPGDREGPSGPPSAGTRAVGPGQGDRAGRPGATARLIADVDLIKVTRRAAAYGCYNVTITLTQSRPSSDESPRNLYRSPKKKERIFFNIFQIFWCFPCSNYPIKCMKLSVDLKGSN